MIGVRAENIDRLIDRNARSRTFSQSRTVSSIEPPISSFSRHELCDFFLCFSANKSFF